MASDESRTYPAATARFRLREPFNGLSHLIGAALGIAALALLVNMARGKPWHVSGFAIYGTTLILLYLASALYHSLPLSERGVARLRMLDRVGIYLLIAGTYTPLCLVPLRGGWGFSADLGVAAQNGGNQRLMRSLMSQSLDDTLRELRFTPVLQLGVSYRF
jgi:predicted membrane channel-forming protein YqfA (hemolysin III family)